MEKIAELLQQIEERAFYDELDKMAGLGEYASKAFQALKEGKTRIPFSGGVSLTPRQLLDPAYNAIDVAKFAPGIKHIRKNMADAIRHKRYLASETDALRRPPTANTLLGSATGAVGRKLSIAEAPLMAAGEVSPIPGSGVAVGGLLAGKNMLFNLLKKKGVIAKDLSELKPKTIVRPEIEDRAKIESGKRLNKELKTFAPELNPNLSDEEAEAVRQKNIQKQLKKPGIRWQDEPQ